MKNKILILIGIIFLVPSILGDVISTNSGGSPVIVITSNNILEGFFSCYPTTCSSLEYECGTWGDGCGNTINCGTCASGYSCGTLTPGQCSPPAIGAGQPFGGGTSGGGGTSQQEAFLSPELLGVEVVPDSFNIPATIGIISSSKISVSNTRSSALDITIKLTDSIKNIVSFEQSSFNIGVGETKILDFSIATPSEPGIYTGRIILSTSEGELEIPFALNVKSRTSLFDISIDVAREDRIIGVGENLIGQITLIQASLQEEVDVLMNYVIKDFEGNSYDEQSETVMVFKQKTYGHEFNTQNFAPGKYVIGAEVIYSGGVATASYQFEVIEEKITTTAWIYIGALILIAFVIVVILLSLKKYRGGIKSKKVRRSLRENSVRSVSKLNKKKKK